MDTSKRKQVIFGVALGVSIGLFIDSLFLLFTSAWLAVIIVPIIIPVIIFAAIFGYLGFKNYFPKASWFTIILIILILWPLCLNGPIWVRQARFRWIANHEIPMYRHAKLISTQIVAVRGDGGTWIDRDFLIEDKYNTVLDFYRSGLMKNGWEIAADYEISVYSDKEYKGVGISAKKQNRYLAVSILRDTKDIDPQSTLLKIHLDIQDTINLKI